MDYIQIYNQIITRAKNRVIEGYTERHHIIPRCMGGTNDKGNLVDLTAREHYICHKLLCEIHPTNKKLKYAYWAMCNLSNKDQYRDYKVSSIDYGNIREEFSKQHSQWMLENNPTRGRSKTQEEIDNWRESYGDKWQGEHNPNYGSTRSVETKQIQSEIRKEWHKNLSEEEREVISKKLSESNKGRVSEKKGIPNPKHSQWMKENNPFKGKTHTDEVKQMLSEINSKPKTDVHKQNISLNSPNNKQCIIEGVTYRGVAEAARQLDLSENTVRGRVKNKNFKEWNYVEETR
jgi:hypothetical protein